MTSARAAIFPDLCIFPFKGLGVDVRFSARLGYFFDYERDRSPVSKANGVVFVGGIFLLFPLTLLLAHFYLLIRLSDSISQHARTAGEREESDTEGEEEENFFR